MSSDGFVAAEVKRGDCFRLLAACFYPPDRKALLEEDVPGNLRRLLESVCPEAASHAEGMAGALSRTEDVELAAAHAKLFVGPFELQAPPYGSVYLDSGRRLMGDSTIEVLRFYRRAGLSLIADFEEAPDHIAAELEFMYYLVGKETRAIRHGDRNGAYGYLEMQRKFQGNYLRPWVEPFCESIRTGSDHEFYRLLADGLSTFIMNTPVPGTLPEKIGPEA